MRYAFLSLQQRGVRAEQPLRLRAPILSLCLIPCQKRWVVDLLAEQLWKMCAVQIRQSA